MRDLFYYYWQNCTEGPELLVVSVIIFNRERIVIHGVIIE